MTNEKQEIIIYKTPEGKVSVDVVYNNETFWLTQKAMAELFGCSTDNISLHLKNIFKSGELNQNSVTEEFSATASDGKNYKTKFFNLDAIIAVGYRVNSHNATQFRIWATQTLKEYIIKGFAMVNDSFAYYIHYTTKKLNFFHRFRIFWKLIFNTVFTY